MEMPSNENSQPSMNSISDADNQHETIVPDGLNNACKESKHEVAEEEVRGILAVIASTGKFWHDWDKLKSMLSFQLKQVWGGMPACGSSTIYGCRTHACTQALLIDVHNCILVPRLWYLSVSLNLFPLSIALLPRFMKVLSEYPEGKMADEQQIASLGETYPELVKRLDEALNSFTEGPPFTLQRLCEILLDAQTTYPNLSKLALALEKNLLVTTMLTVSNDPYPQPMVQNSAEPNKATEEPKLHSDSVQNGVEPMVGDRDEVMAEVEQADIDDDMTIAIEAFEDIVGSSETNSVQTNNS